MADLLALQPNMDIHLHIVAPADKREKVLREIRRPVFSLLDRGPLYNQCSFISYDSMDSLAETSYLSHMTDTIVGEYEEFRRSIVCSSHPPYGKGREQSFARMAYGMPQSPKATAG